MEDLVIPEIGEIQEWYLEKYGEELYGYTRLFRLATKQEGSEEEQNFALSIIEEYQESDEFKNSFVGKFLD